MKKPGRIFRHRNKWYLDMGTNRAWVEVVKNEARLTFYGVIQAGSHHAKAMEDAIRAIALWKEKASELEPKGEV